MEKSLIIGLRQCKSEDEPSVFVVPKSKELSLAGFLKTFSLVKSRTVLKAKSVMTENG